MQFTTLHPRKGPFTYDVSHQGGRGESADFRFFSDKGEGEIRRFLIFKESARWADSFYKSKCSYVCLSVCLSVCMSHFLTPFYGLFALTSQSPMSKLFIYSESVRKSNGKKWSQIWKLLLKNGVKLPKKKKFKCIFSFAYSVWTSSCPHFLKSNVQTSYIFGILGKK